MSNNKTLISLLFAVAVIALTITVFLPVLNIPQQAASTPAFMVAIMLFKIAGAIAGGVLIMLFVSDRPWRKLRHSEDIVFTKKQDLNAAKQEPFNHAYHGHSSK
ncbi:hypothetical protein FX988_00148 [Paraglaciecola mesophila]|uniref:Uncharacterized protein n=1 Tax=Paraglaciecola mesophila TaxID=197222 RepID=A0A857JFE6_9ALTE|nr:hypothetical protein [Paraglaciecola mesophila]QHJ09940.1 hypothetical protein FX988_00148 [Paraglaciecola mesophila]